MARNPPKKNDLVIVVGAGTIGLMIIAALRAMGFENKIVNLARYDFQSQLAKKLGANKIISEFEKEPLYDKISKEKKGTTLFKPIIGENYLFGNIGPDIIYDSIATESSLDDCLHYVRSNGTIIIVGMGFNVTKNIDWSVIASKEIEVKGSMMYGLLPNGEDPFDKALNFIGKNPELYQGIVTHLFQVEDYKNAFLGMSNKKEIKGIKLAFDFR